MVKKNEILKLLSANLRNILEHSNLNYALLQELRIRINNPFLIIYDGKEFFLSQNGQLVKENTMAYVVMASDIKESIEYISSFSLYAYEDEIRQGFITVLGGHRIGLAGKVIIENHQVKSIKYISFINIRVSNERKGCGLSVLPFIYEEGKICHTLIISPPGCGKTTLLRDLIRLISDGNEWSKGINVGLVDERSEIGACYQGIPQNDVGMRTDVLDCCPKAEGMLMLIRSMSPAVIAVDEIGKGEDIDALAYAMNCGCQMLATVHGASVEEVRNKPLLNRLIKEYMFKRFIVMSGENGPGYIKTIFNYHGDILYRNEA